MEVVFIAAGPQQACPSNDYFQRARASIDPGINRMRSDIWDPDSYNLSISAKLPYCREGKLVELRDQKLLLAGQTIDLDLISKAQLVLSENDRAYLRGDHGNVAKAAMETICVMAAVENASSLIDVDKGHIDGCILAHDANLIFAEKMAQLGAQVIIPTTINAISVDRENWQNSQLDQDFGKRASRLADAYVQMGVKPTFTCAPYLLTDKPQLGENIGWSESNAVIFANTVLGARYPKTSRLSRSIHRDDGTGASCWYVFNTWKKSSNKNRGSDSSKMDI